ncbi:tyrosine-protein phosphatase non-receptor type substrate 1-like [Aegotheles albertisi]
MAPAPRALPLSSLLLLRLLLQRAPGAGAQESGSFHLYQPQEKVSVTSGETLTLTCTTSGTGPIGPLKWLKGWGYRNETIFYQMSSFPRVTRAQSESNTDFSIHIRDVRPEDAGTYYCVKFSRSVQHGEVLFQHGKGTEVSVRAKPTPPVVSGPEHRAGPGQSVSVTCTAGGFFPENITVKWFKDTDPITAQPPQVTREQTKSSYNMSSTVVVTLQKDDVRSQLICEVQHPTLPAPLRQPYPLGRALRVPPRVSVAAEPSPVEVNKSVSFTCDVRGFYPGEVAVTWLENGTEVKVENSSRAQETRRGFFELKSVVEVQATEEKNGSVFTCRVVHDGQDPISGVAELRIAAPAWEGLGDRTLAENAGMLLLSSPGLWLGIVLEKGLLGGLLIFLFRRRGA